MGATQKTHRECCNYCMWYGPVNQDGTMRKHRPATSEDRFGRKVQNRHEDHCQGSHKPYARFGCETEETATVDDQQTSTAPTAADLPKGTRVTGPEGRTGTVNGADVGRVAIKGHASYGREYVGVDWDAVDGDMGLNRRSRPFVDELTIITPPESPRFVVRQNGNVGHGGYFFVYDRTTHEWVSTKPSRSGAQHITDCLNDGTMVLGPLGKAVAAQKPVVEASSDTNEYGVFEDGECIETGFHGGYGRVAAGAAAKVREDDPANEGLSYEVKVLCPEHDEQAKDTCEDCNTGSVED